MRMHLAAFLLALPIASCAMGATIDLRPAVTVGAGQVKLDDIARISTETLEDLQRLRAIPLGMAPRGGSVRQIDRESIERELRTREAVLAPQVKWLGARQVTLEGATRILEGRRIAEAAREAALRCGVIAPSEVHTQRDLELPGGEVTLSARPLPSRSKADRHCLVWVDVLVDGRFIRSVPVSFSAYARQQTVRPPPSETLHAGIVDLSAEVPAKAEARAGRIVPAAPAADPVVPRVVGVSRGEWATLRTALGVITLESRVQVLQDGLPGQTVRVRAGSAGVIISVQVAGAHELEIVQ